MRASSEGWLIQAWVVNGNYGPQAVAAVEALQQANGCLRPAPWTRPAKGPALGARSQGWCRGGEGDGIDRSREQTLKLAGYGDGPVDGVWTDELTVGACCLDPPRGLVSWPVAASRGVRTVLAMREDEVLVPVPCGVSLLGGVHVAVTVVQGPHPGLWAVAELGVSLGGAPVPVRYLLDIDPDSRDFCGSFTDLKGCPLEASEAEALALLEDELVNWLVSLCVEPWGLRARAYRHAMGWPRPTQHELDMDREVSVADMLRLVVLGARHAQLTEEDAFLAEAVQCLPGALLPKALELFQAGGAAEAEKILSVLAAASR